MFKFIYKIYSYTRLLYNIRYISINKIKKVDKTLFSKFGNKIYFLIILLYIFLIFSFKKIKNE